MEGGVVGPTTSSSHSRPVRSSARFYYHTPATNGGSPATFSGHVRRWEKKWVRVSSSLTSKHRKQSNNAPNPDKSTLLLCKWTPLSTADADKSSDELPRRKFRYTPIAVFEDKKKPAVFKDKTKLSGDKSGEIHRPVKKLGADGDDIYRMLDINNDQMGDHMEASKSILTQYSRRTHWNHGLGMENRNKGGQLDVVNLSGF